MCRRRDQQHGHGASSEHVADDCCTPFAEASRPAEGDHVGLDVVGDLEHVLAGNADPDLEPDVLGMRAMAAEKLPAPGLELVMRLVAEEREGRLVVDVEDLDLEVARPRQ